MHVEMQDLVHAHHAHREWRQSFERALRAGADLHPDLVGRDDCCAFGRWLYREAVAAYGDLDAYSVCVDCHAAFHVEAARTISAGAFEHLLAPGSAYADAALAVEEAIEALRRQALQRLERSLRPTA